MYQGIIDGLGTLFRSSLHAVRSRRRARPPRRGFRSSARPRVESLESRRLLATFHVDTLLDVPVDLASAPLSLREAVIQANANAQDDKIVLTLPGTYELTIGGADEDAAATGDLDITDFGYTTTIQPSANAAGPRIIDALGNDRVFHVQFDFISGVAAGLTVKDTTITGGDATQGFLTQIGGGIFNDGGDVTLDGSTLANNVAYDGGGIYSVGGGLKGCTSSTVRSRAIWPWTPPPTPRAADCTVLPVSSPSKTR